MPVKKACGPQALKIARIPLYQSRGDALYQSLHGQDWVGHPELLQACSGVRGIAAPSVDAGHQAINPDGSWRVCERISDQPNRKLELPQVRLSRRSADPDVEEEWIVRRELSGAVELR